MPPENDNEKNNEKPSNLLVEFLQQPVVLETVKENNRQRDTTRLMNSVIPSESELQTLAKIKQRIQGDHFITPFVQAFSKPMLSDNTLKEFADLHAKNPSVDEVANFLKKNDSAVFKNTYLLMAASYYFLYGNREYGKDQAPIEFFMQFPEVNKKKECFFTKKFPKENTNDFHDGYFLYKNNSDEWELHIIQTSKVGKSHEKLCIDVELINEILSFPLVEGKDTFKKMEFPGKLLEFIEKNKSGYPLSIFQAIASNIFPTLDLQKLSMDKAFSIMGRLSDKTELSEELDSVQAGLSLIDRYMDFLFSHLNLVEARDFLHNYEDSEVKGTLENIEISMRERDAFQKKILQQLERLGSKGVSEDSIKEVAKIYLAYLTNTNFDDLLKKEMDEFYKHIDQKIQGENLTDIKLAIPLESYQFGGSFGNAVLNKSLFEMASIFQKIQRNDASFDAEKEIVKVIASIKEAISVDIECQKIEAEIKTFTIVFDHNSHDPLKLVNDAVNKINRHAAFSDSYELNNTELNGKFSKLKESIYSAIDSGNLADHEIFMKIVKQVMAIASQKNETIQVGDAINQYSKLLQKDGNIPEAISGYYDQLNKSLNIPEKVNLFLDEFLNLRIAIGGSSVGKVVIEQIRELRSLLGDNDIEIVTAYVKAYQAIFLSQDYKRASIKYGEAVKEVQLEIEKIKNPQHPEGSFGLKELFSEEVETGEVKREILEVDPTPEQGKDEKNTDNDSKGAQVSPTDSKSDDPPPPEESVVVEDKEVNQNLSKSSDGKKLLGEDVLVGFGSVGGLGVSTTLILANVPAISSFCLFAGFSALGCAIPGIGIGFAGLAAVSLLIYLADKAFPEKEIVKNIGIFANTCKEELGSFFGCAQSNKS